MIIIPNLNIIFGLFIALASTQISLILIFIIVAQSMNRNNKMLKSIREVFGEILKAMENENPKNKQIL